jgi:hypothetical protein
MGKYGKIIHQCMEVVFLCFLRTNLSEAMAAMVRASEMRLDCSAAHWSLQPYTCHLNGLDDFARKLLWFNPDSCVVVIWDIITWIIDQSLACQGQVQQFKNRKETDTSTMCSTGRVANLHRFKNPCGVKMSHAQIDCSTRNQRLCLTSISQEIYGATCKF